jgi:Fe-S-cluster-containing dehydrogenase component
MPNGIVMQYNNQCIGCTICVSACPYTAPVYNPVTNKVSKCDLCYDRLEKGMDPACVKSCISRALGYGEFENIVTAYGNRQDIREFDNRTFIPEPTTSPSIVIAVFEP